MPRKPLTDLPVMSWTDFDSVDLVKRALRQHELGHFWYSSQVVDMMGRDDRIAAKLSDRILTLLGKPLDVEAAGHAQRRGTPAKMLEDSWCEMFPQAQLAQLEHWGLTLGVALGELVWSRNGKRWMPTLHKVWSPRYLQWRWDTRSFWVQTMDGMVEISPGDRRWVVFAPFGMELGWMRGLVRCLSIPWLIRQWGLRDWARYSEVHGMPMRKGIVPASASEERKRKFLRDIAGMGRETSVEVPQGQDGTHYDFELVEAQANTWEGFEKLLDKAEDAVDIAILGQNLTTKVKGGSRAAAQVHQGVKDDIVDADNARLMECLHAQVLRPWAQVNFGSEDLAPLARYRTEPPDDQGARATGLLALGQAIKAIQSTGANPDVDALLDEYGVPRSDDAGEPPSPAPVPPAHPEEPEPPEPKANSLTHEPPRLTGTIRGQLYADALADRAAEHGRTIAKPHLDAVLSAVNQAESYEDLRRRLVDALGAMGPDEMADLMGKAMVMAKLAGRHAVLEDL